MASELDILKLAVRHFAYLWRLEHLPDDGNAPGHGHQVPGIWDVTNGPPDGGKACKLCTAWHKMLRLAKPKKVRR